MRGGRLIVHRASSDAIAAAALNVIADERVARQVGEVYTHTNTSTAELSTAVSTAGIDHEQVGYQ